MKYQNKEVDDESYDHYCRGYIGLNSRILFLILDQLVSIRKQGVGIERADKAGASVEDLAKGARPMNLTIKKFGCLENMAVPLDGIVQILGPPSCGRTTIVEAFRYLVEGPWDGGKLGEVGYGNEELGNIALRTPKGLATSDNQSISQIFGMGDKAIHGPLPDLLFRDDYDFDMFCETWFRPQWTRRLLFCLPKRMHARADAILENMLAEDGQAITLAGRLSIKRDNFLDAVTKLDRRIRKTTLTEDEIKETRSRIKDLESEAETYGRLERALDSSRTLMKDKEGLWKAVKEDFEALTGMEVTKTTFASIRFNKRPMGCLSSSEATLWEMCCKANAYAHTGLPYVFLDLPRLFPLAGLELFLQRLSGAFRGIVVLTPYEQLTIPSAVSYSVDTNGRLYRLEKA